MNNSEKIDLLENGEQILAREYAECIFNTKETLEEYKEETDILIIEHVKNAEFYKKLDKSELHNLLLFMFECNRLALKMSGGITFVYSKKHNCVGASIYCDELVFNEDEIASLNKLCTVSSQMNFFISPLNDIPLFKGSIAEFAFDLSK